ncbi:MAG: DNA repair protein RadA [Candidatus Doudnabacteria bacterium]|nr:DNA repair protein RadA [Candidatus Doudnabacteria bacterium]
MAKQSIVYICSNCGYKTPRWQGKCSNCNEWNTLEKSQISNIKHQIGTATAGKMVDLSEIAENQKMRIKTGIEEFDGVLGGGIVPGSLVLLGGDPGIGKSTLALQLCLNIREQSVLYVSGEESASQIKLRAGRISKSHTLQVLADTDLDVVLATILEHKPDLVVIDSIQTLYSEEASGVAGGVAQVTGAVQKIMQTAKQNHISFIIIGHVTKEGYLAGPKTLEHMVDTVLYLEGERFAAFRILRCVKNRFGTTNEVGVFEMQGQGLVEVKNPSQLFLGEDSIKASGNIITSVMEGSRALLLEIQALTSVSNFGYPKRTTSGYDNNRLQLITAILSKRAGLNLSNQDIYINVVGGLKIEEPAADLAVAVAIISSIKDQVLDGTIIVGELGLSGEVRFVPNLEKRIKEAEKLGFKQIICPKTKVTTGKIKILPVRTLGDAVKLVS